MSNPLDFFNIASKLAKKIIKVLWLPLDETSKVVAKLDERFADCAVVCGTQSVHYMKREDDTCIATALNSPFTRDERLTTHRLMPVEKVAAGLATSPPLQTPPQQHNADKTVGNFVLVRFETNRCSTKTYLVQCTETDGNELQLSFLRSRNNVHTIFAFPNVTDLCWVDKEHVVTVLTTPSLDNRERYTFEQSLPVVE